MMITVVMWTCTILFGVLAIGFFLCGALMLFGMIYQRKDIEMVIAYGLMLLLSAGICTGLVFAAIAMGRNLV